MKTSPLASLPSVKSRLRVRHWMFGVGCSMFAFLFTGCTVLTYKSPTGEHFTRSSLGSKTSIAHLTFEATTNGVRKVELRGYQNDSSQALGVVTDAAVRAAITAAKP